MRIGRSNANDIVLDDTAVSKRHCKIEVFDNYIRVIDLNSRNGTFVDQSPVKEANITLNRSFGIGNTDFYLKEGDIKEFKISGELSDIFSILTEKKRKTNTIEPKTEESETKYGHFLQDILEKAITCDEFTAFIHSIQADLSSILNKGSLFFINQGEWFTVLNQLQLNESQPLKQLLKDHTETEGSLVYNGTNLYYRILESNTHSAENFLLFLTHQKLPVPRSILDTFLKRERGGQVFYFIHLFFTIWSLNNV